MYICVQFKWENAYSSLPQEIETWSAENEGSAFCSMISDILLDVQGVPGHILILYVFFSFYGMKLRDHLQWSRPPLQRNLGTRVGHPTKEYKLEIPAHVWRLMKSKVQGTWTGYWGQYQDTRTVSSLTQFFIEATCALLNKTSYSFFFFFFLNYFPALCYLLSVWEGNHSYWIKKKYLSMTF